jgi:hypothetical protein
MPNCKYCMTPFDQRLSDAAHWHEFCSNFCERSSYIESGRQPALAYDSYETEGWPEPTEALGTYD